MRAVTLDTEGRLVEFHEVPPQLEEETSQPKAPDWTPLFSLAGLTLSDFHAVPPQWTPRGYADQRAAWEGPMPGWPDQKLRIEAGAYRGRPTFSDINTWSSR